MNIMINISETLKRHSEQRRAESMDWASKDYAYSRDNIIYIGGVPIYTIADTSEGRWQVTPSEAEAIVTRIRQSFIDCGGGHMIR